MKSRLSSVANLTNILFIVLVICVPIILSTSAADNEKLENYVPARWRIIYPSLKPPQIEIKLLKGQVSADQTMMSSVEYVLSNNNNNENNESQLLNHGLVAETGNRNFHVEVGKNQKKSGLDSRTIIRTPKFGCPPGQKKDYMGNCRVVFELN